MKRDKKRIACSNIALVCDFITSHTLSRFELALGHETSKENSRARDAISTELKVSLHVGVDRVLSFFGLLSLPHFIF